MNILTKLPDNISLKTRKGWRNHQPIDKKRNKQRYTHHNHQPYDEDQSRDDRTIIRKLLEKKKEKYMKSEITMMTEIKVAEISANI